MPDASPEMTERSKPESLRLTMMSPSLTVDDIEDSLAWYTDVVGFTLKERWEHDGELAGAELIAGTTHLMIGQDDWQKGEDRQKGEGFRLYLVTSQDLDEVAAGIKERGGTLETEPQDMPWGGRAFSLVDPSGYKLTIASE